MVRELDFIKEEINTIPQLRLTRFRHVAADGLGDFVLNILTAWKYIYYQPMILVFSFIQFCSVLIGYLLWSQIWFIMPSDLHRGNTIVNILVGNWSLTILAIVSFPIGILTGCTGIAYLFARRNIKLSFAHCFKLSIARYKQLWIFAGIDGWITIEQILDRLERVSNKFSGEKRSVVSVGGTIREVLYFSWKVATIGIYPAILTGKNLHEAGLESLSMVRKEFHKTVILRAGYSVMCWFVGICASLLGYFWVRTSLDSYYSFMLSISIPVAMATFIIMLILRPVFIISSCELYSKLFLIKIINSDKSVYDKSISWILKINILLIILLMVWFFLLYWYLS